MELEALIKHLLAELRNREAVILDNIESLKVGQKVKALNELSRRFHNHREGPYSAPISHLLTVFRHPFSVVS